MQGEERNILTNPVRREGKNKPYTEEGEEWQQWQEGATVVWKGLNNYKTFWPYIVFATQCKDPPLKGKAQK
jgi:hypothetical protein